MQQKLIGHNQAYLQEYKSSVFYNHFPGLISQPVQAKMCIGYTLLEDKAWNL